MHLYRFIKVGSISLLFISFSLYGASEQDQNATYIHLPKVPLVDSKPVTPQKALKVAPLVTVIPKVESKKITISKKEYLEYQKLKAKQK